DYERAVRVAVWEGQPAPAEPERLSEAHIAALDRVQLEAGQVCERIAQLVASRCRDELDALCAPADALAIDYEVQAAELELEAAPLRRQAAEQHEVRSFLAQTAHDLIGGLPWPTHLAEALRPRPELTAEDIAVAMHGMPVGEAAPARREAPS